VKIYFFVVYIRKKSYGQVKLKKMVRAEDFLSPQKDPEEQFQKCDFVLGLENTLLMRRRIQLVVTT
jgi:hypothetical protein